MRCSCVCMLRDALVRHSLSTVPGPAFLQNEADYLYGSYDYSERGGGGVVRPGSLNTLRNAR